MAALIGGIALLFVAYPHGATGATHDQAAKPTIVLVHGAWADASGWNEVTERLQRQGYTVPAPANPLRSLMIRPGFVGGVAWLWKAVWIEPGLSPLRSIRQSPW